MARAGHAHTRGTHTCAAPYCAVSEWQAISARPTGGSRRGSSRFRVSLIRGNIHFMDDTKMRARHDVRAPRWSGADSEELYQMQAWGKGQPRPSTAAYGEQILEMQIDAAARQIRMLREGIRR